MALPTRAPSGTRGCRPGRGREESHTPRTVTAERPSRLGDIAQHLGVHLRVADDALADVVAAGLELRLDQHDAPPPLGQRSRRRPAATRPQRDERHVGRDERRRDTARSGARLARVVRRRATVTRGSAAAARAAGRGRRRRANTCAAPCCSRQSVNPPVDAPTSSAALSRHVDANVGARVSSFSPAARHVTAAARPASTAASSPPACPPCRRPRRRPSPAPPSPAPARGCGSRPAPALRPGRRGAGGPSGRPRWRPSR